MSILRPMTMEKNICALGAREIMKIEPAALERIGRDFQIFPVLENFGRNSTDYQKFQKIPKCFSTVQC